MGGKCRNGNLWEEPGILKAFSPGKTGCNINRRNVFLTCTVELVREFRKFLKGTKSLDFPITQSSLKPEGCGKETRTAPVALPG